DSSLASASASSSPSWPAVASQRSERYWASVCSSALMGHLLSAGAAKLGIRPQFERRRAALPCGWCVIRRGAASRLRLCASFQVALQSLRGDALMGQQDLPPVSPRERTSALRSEWCHQLVHPDPRRGLLEQLAALHPLTVVQQRNKRRLKLRVTLAMITLMVVVFEHSA